MNINVTKQVLLKAAASLSMVLFYSQAHAVDFYLCAGETTKLMPDGTSVVMWGYAEDDNANLSDGCNTPIESPGPLLTVSDTDPVVRIHLLNNLTVGTSLIIAGQSAALTPVMSPPDAQGRVRATSLTAITAPGATGSYEWLDFKPGSFPYQSGTHMAVQVQMGLYGGIKKDFAPAMAYDGVTYDQDAVIFLSEIDPLLHQAVSNGAYGTTGPSSTINYQPKYYLVNGVPYSGTTTPIAAGAAGQRTLLRFFNMGLRTVAPTILDHHVKLVAEDGRPYHFAREQYSVMLAAGKSRDAILISNQAGSVAMYDRMLNLSNGTGTSGAGGFYAFLETGGAVAGQPVATDDSYVVAEDTLLSIAAPGVLTNDTDPDGGTLSATLASAVTQGTLLFDASGAFNYTPSPNFNGSATFTYLASDGSLLSSPARVTITVTPVNDPPVAVADAYSGAPDTVMTVVAPGVLANDSDVDGDAISATAVDQPVNGTLALNSDGSFTYTPTAGFAGSDSFTYTATDGALSSNLATVSLTIVGPTNQPPVATNDEVTMPMNTSLTFDLLANDSDPDGTLDPASVVVSGTFKKGNVLVNNLDGTVTFTPRINYRGSESFTYTVKDNLGAVSNSATVRISVTR